MDVLFLITRIPEGFSAQIYKLFFSIAKHAQRVVRERNIGIQWSSDNFVFQIFNPTKRIGQFAVSIFIQTKRQSIDGKITPVLIIFKRSIFYYWLAGILPV